MNFLEKLDNLMIEHDLNKSALSKLCGIPYTTIDGWYKKGCEDIRLSTLKKLATYFNTSLDYWAYDENEEDIKLSNDRQKFIENVFQLDDFKFQMVNRIVNSVLDESDK